MKIIIVTFGEWLIEYLDLLEKYLQEYSDEFIKKSIEEFGEDETYRYEDEYFRYAKVYPNILRKSFIITCYSYLEHELNDECRFQQKSKSLPIEVNDLKGDGIERAKNYLKKLADFDLSTSKAWEDIKNIQAIRNCIVHGDGILTKCKDRNIQSYIDKRSDISIINDEIIISADYCRYVVKTFNALELDIKRKEEPKITDEYVTDKW